MLNRVLLLFGNDIEKSSLLNFGKFLSDNYGAEVFGLYVKDIRKYEALPPTVEGLIVDTSSSFLIKEWEKAEEGFVDRAREQFSEFFADKKENFLVGEGITSEVVYEKMRGFDLLLLPSGDRLSSDVKDILRTHYKPIILVPKVTENRLEKIVVANDGSERANRSLFNFMNMFTEIKNFKIVSVDVDEEDDDTLGYLDSIKCSYELIKKSGDEVKALSEELDESDLLIMGDLKHSFLLERITRHAGIHILEEIKKLIFIG